MRQASQVNDPLKSASVVAIASVVEPLIDLMFDTGLTVYEFSKIVRERAVMRAATRVGKQRGHGYKSSVAILTGLPRSEVARILKAADISIAGRTGLHPVRKVLAGWYDNPMFLDDSGEPLVMPIFGAKRTFEHLVARYGGGIPVRAMLDQLTQINAVEVLPSYRIKAKTRIPVFTGLTTTAIATLGDRARDFLDTLRNNLVASTPLFEGTAMLTEVEADAVPLIRRELAAQAAVFIEGANSLLKRPSAKPRQPTNVNTQKCRIGVTAYYFQINYDENLPKKESAVTRRKNLSRQLRKSPKRLTKVE